MIDRLTVFYTHGLRGDLERLPRLYSAMHALRRDHAPSLLVDLGDSCAPDVWHCRVTEGRSVLVALDGMGYDAANIEDMAWENVREAMPGATTMALVDAGTPWACGGPPLHDASIGVAAGAADGTGKRLVIDLRPAARTQVNGNRLALAGLASGEFAVVQLALTPDGPRLIEAREQEVAEGTPPDVTILASIEFILAEADYVRRQRGLD
jgi:hypothetical protein